MLTYKYDCVGTDVTFAKQMNGYNKDQVDDYIDTLGQAYQTIYEKYTIVSGKYNGLLKTCEQLEEQSQQSRAGTDALTKTLYDAEVMAQNIIAAAREQAEIIVAEAAAEAEKIKGDACIERLASKRSIEAANESLAQTIAKLQSLQVS